MELCLFKKKKSILLLSNTTSSPLLILCAFTTILLFSACLKIFVSAKTKQKRYIQYCVENPDHNATPFNKPKWVSKESYTRYPGRKRFLG